MLNRCAANPFIHFIVLDALVDAILFVKDSRPFWPFLSKTPDQFGLCFFLIL